MTQIFTPRSDTAFRWSLAAIGFVLVGFFPARALVENSSYATGVGEVVDQPVPFSHKHHVADDGINCVYCHTSVEKSNFAGFPATETCMGCHSTLWKDAAPLAPIRESLASGQPIHWNRVNTLPEYVYFNHSVHVTNGIGCESCHGRVDEMPLLKKAKAFHMEECLECHRDPARFIRPQEDVFRFGWKSATPQRELGQRLVSEHHIDTKQLTECVTCHR